ncbi:MAG: transposase [Candidatus Hydrogenedentes bacterium]|nr:transposase [Candidatus Hydrogenedentota bacterium]
MSRTHRNLLYQIAFSTKARVRFPTPDLRPEAHRCFANSVQGVDGIPRIINAAEDHVQLLVKLSQNHALNNVLSEVKSNSSG